MSMRALFLFLVVLACVSFAAPLASAQTTGPRVSARFESGVLLLPARGDLLIEVEGGTEVVPPSVPAVQGLRYGPLRGPSRFQQIEMRGGRQRVVTSLTWSLPVQPEAVGEYEVPSFNVRVDGKDYATRPALLKVIKDEQGEKLGLFEIEAPPSIYEGQPFTLRLRLGFDAALQGQLNHYNLSLPWLGELGGLVELDSPPISTSRSAGKVALNSRVLIEVARGGEVKRNGATFVTFEIERRFVATRSGKLELSTSHFEFGHKSEGLSSFFNNDRAREFVNYKRHAPVVIDVRAVPEEGRPLDWSGAVGVIEAQATADRRQVDAGDSIKLAVSWTGDANLEFFTPPDLSRLEAFQGFRIYGTTDRKAWDRRTVTYDLAPLSSDVQTIPPVPLSVFDTQKGAYTTVTTGPIEIQVRALKNAAELAPEGSRSAVVVDLRDLKTTSIATGDLSGPGARSLSIVAAGVVGGWLLLRRAVRRNGDPDAPRQRARRRARRELEKALASASTSSAQAHALSAFLGARTGESGEAWVGRDVRAWERMRGDGAAPLEREALDELHKTLAALDERTWAGKDEPVERASLLQLADRLVKGGL